MKLRWLPWVISIGFMIFVISRLTEYEQLAVALQNGDLRWIGVALVCQVLFFALFIRLYQLCFRASGMKRSYLSLVPVIFAAVFANTLTPSAGVAGTAIFVKEARRHDHTAIRATAGFVVETIFQQVGFIAIVICSLLYLYVTDGFIGIMEMIVAGLVLLIIAVQVVVFALSYWKPGVLERVLNMISSVSNWVVRRFRKKSLVSDMWSKRGAGEVREVVSEVLGNKKSWPLMIVTAIIMQLAMIGTFYSLLFAFGQGANVKAATATFVASSIAGSILLGPQGIGIVEAGLTIILTHYGVPSGPAALIAIMFRGLNFWLPLFGGFVSFRKLRLFQ